MTTYEKIKAEGLALFSRYGYDGTSIDDIAKKVGIKKASMYSHIRSKDELYLSILEEVINWDKESLDQLNRMIALAGVRAKLKAIFYFYYHLYKDEVSNSKILFLNRSLTFPPEELSDRIKDSYEEYNAWQRKVVSDIFFEGVNSGRIREMDARDFLTTFFCAIDGTFAASRHLAREENFSRVDSVWEQLWISIKC